mmetsp:Transcript_4984/g.12488  ORF Transcript_4984/g.12488 Transcript_4984/m.12488 type:complete len:269 (-) Transcript_4984:704-1510(-)|eukprot:CAMPEP_0179009100 /NCGR_PEP_ID=MMETSP0795-20121207/16091_1 /TAXON_ID=88552 /ORGANISM="Amoebophrya sp., Strain Ameob2" /LENGTH=268 /DNA_ID=CAMNT_0020704273 /DNA_START=14 /DNA_END=820 /DNA_ORIENTATION=-
MDGSFVNPKLICSLARQAALAQADFEKEGSCGICDVEADGLLVYATIIGPEQTAYSDGRFRVKLQVTAADFPRTPPKAYFLTKIFHPNVNTQTGDICVNALQKDWNPAEWSLAHIFRVIRCLMIIPFPESALNPEAARLFMEDYEAFFAHANMMANLHARKHIKGGKAVLASSTVSSSRSAAEKENAARKNSTAGCGAAIGAEGCKMGLSQSTSAGSLAGSQSQPGETKGGGENGGFKASQGGASGKKPAGPTKGTAAKKAKSALRRL